jgi:asparagine synthase (glutamine-hydrolysing)
MCGICGVLNFNKTAINTQALQRMADAIKHRGPDDQGIYHDQNIGLGHRRLSIIDLSSDARQPMADSSNSYQLSYNGEIYNFREIRSELVKLGYRFRSQSDTEVVLNSYIEWGENCVRRFNGMFAFAIWDRKNESLFIARDRYGIKPLYYTFSGNSFIFSSEQKSLLEYPGVKREIDLETLPEYFTFQNILTSRTLLKGISLFPAGHYSKLESDKRYTDLNAVQYWDYDFNEDSEIVSENEYLEELDRLFKQAVNRQLVSDVELGAYLSGGLDSGSITAVAAQELPYIKSFTCGFDLSSASGLELTYDERKKSEFMSYLFKTEHYEMVLKAGDMERAIPNLTWHLEEPRVGQSYPNYYAAQLASKFVKVVLSGTGGDEIFGGYPWRYYRAAKNDSFDNYVDRYYSFWQRLLPDEYISKVFRPVKQEIAGVNPKEIFRNVFSSHATKLSKPEDYINHSMYFEAKTFLHGLLIVEDKLSMAHGLENRVPFLDNDLVDFGMKLPVKYKLGNLGEVARLNENDPGDKQNKYFSKTKDGKLLLRKMMGRYIPKSISEGVKQGFSAPDASWFKGESITYVKNRLYDRDAAIYEYMDRKTIKKLVGEHLDGKQNRRLLIWSLLNFEQWCETYLQ